MTRPLGDLISWTISLSGFLNSQLKRPTAKYYSSCGYIITVKLFLLVIKRGDMDVLDKFLGYGRFVRQLAICKFGAERRVVIGSRLDWRVA